VPRLEKVPPAPKHLTDAEAMAWRQTGRQLLRAGLLTALDLAALESYCVLLAAYRSYKAKVEQFGPLLLSKKSDPPTPYISPVYTIYLGLVDRLAKARAELGLCAPSRVRLKAAPPTDDRAGGGPDIPSRQRYTAAAGGGPDPLDSPGIPFRSRA
jgi:P27 family predicted phage terminase small subunit